LGLGFASETLPFGENGGASGREKPTKETLVCWGKPLGGTDKISFYSACFYRSAPGATPQALNATKQSGCKLAVCLHPIVF